MRKKQSADDKSIQNYRTCQELIDFETYHSMQPAKNSTGLCTRVALAEFHCKRSIR